MLHFFYAWPRLEVNVYGGVFAKAREEVLAERVGEMREGGAFLRRQGSAGMAGRAGRRVSFPS